jgi:hypothetical protein
MRVMKSIEFMVAAPPKFQASPKHSGRDARSTITGPVSGT